MAAAGLVLLALFLAGTCLDVFRTNRRLVNLTQAHRAPLEALDWLRRFDRGEFYVHVPGE
jgi:hypothetical protein